MTLNQIFPDVSKTSRSSAITRSLSTRLFDLIAVVTQLLRWLSSIRAFTLSTALFTARDCFITSMQYLSSSIILWMPRICPSMLFNLLIILSLSFILPPYSPPQREGYNYHNHKLFYCQLC